MALARVMVVEDDVFSATTLEAALVFSGFEVVGHCRSAKASLELLTAKGADVAVLDIDLGPGPTGVDVAYALRERKADLGLVFLTSFSEPRVSRVGNRPLPKGARYTTKSQLKEMRTLGAMILQAKYLPLESGSSEYPTLPLTSSQIEVLKLVVQGLTNAEIARLQGVSEKAIEHSVARTAKALGIKKTDKHNLRVQLVHAYAQISGKALPNI